MTTKDHLKGIKDKFQQDYNHSSINTRSDAPLNFTDAATASYLGTCEALKEAGLGEGFKRG